MRNAALLIFTFAGQQEMVERHLTYFLRGHADLIFVCPTDATVHVPTGHTIFSHGTSQQFGHSLMSRIERAISAAIGMGYETICCIEGDSIVLDRVPKPQGDGIDCFLFECGEHSVFAANHYCHWPWLMNRGTAMWLVEQLRHMLANGDIERGFPDRMIGWAAQIAGIELRHRPDLAYSQNRLDSPRYMAEARAAIANGARFVHGCKTAEELAELTA